MSHPSSLKAYWFIRKNRYRKKRAIKKQLVQISFDKTTTIYSLLVVGYLFASIFIFNDFMEQFEAEFLFLEQQMVERFWLILMIVPLRYVFQSFRHPGLLITSSEYQLAILPHSIKKIAIYIAVEKWIKQLFIYGVMSAIIILLTPIQAELIVIYFSLFWFIEVLTTSLQWKLFQAKLMTKICFVGLFGLVSLLGALTNYTKILSISMFVFLVVCNILVIKKLFVQINWGRVTEVNNYLVWNMPLISKATKVKFKKQRKYSIFLNRESRKRPFPYKEASIHKRLWIQLFRENSEYIINVIGGLFFVLVVIPFVHDFVMMIGIALSIHVYSVFTASIFKERFYSGIVQVLPWDVESYQRTMRQWAYYGYIPIMIPIIIYSILQFSWWSIGFLLLICSLFVLNVEVKMSNATNHLNKKIGQLTFADILAFLSLLLICFSLFHPYLSIASIGIIGYIYFFLKSSKRKMPL